MEHMEDLATKEIAWLNIMEHDALAKCLDTCIDRWQNAGPEVHKKMFAVCRCRHFFVGLLAWSCFSHMRHDSQW